MTCTTRTAGNDIDRSPVQHAPSSPCRLPLVYPVRPRTAAVSTRREAMNKRNHTFYRDVLPTPPSMRSRRLQDCSQAPSPDSALWLQSCERLLYSVMGERTGRCGIPSASPSPDFQQRCCTPRTFAKRLTSPNLPILSPLTPHTRWILSDEGGKLPPRTPPPPPPPIVIPPPSLPEVVKPRRPPPRVPSRITKPLVPVSHRPPQRLPAEVWPSREKSKKPKTRHRGPILPYTPSQIHALQSVDIDRHAERLAALRPQSPTDGASPSPLSMMSRPHSISPTRSGPSTTGARSAYNDSGSERSMSMTSDDESLAP